jgi:hypothetical protein
MDEDPYVGRLRSNLKATNFFIYDNGFNPKEDKGKMPDGAKQRLQFGSIIYSDMDKFGKKGPRNMDVYIPTIDQKGIEVTYWPDTDARKADVGLEYLSQQSEAQGSTFRMVGGRRDMRGIMKFT